MGHPQGLCNVNRLKLGFKGWKNIRLSSWIVEEKSKCNSMQLVKIILFLFNLFTHYTNVTENNPSVDNLWIQVQMKRLLFFSFFSLLLLHLLMYEAFSCWIWHAGVLSGSGHSWVCSIQDLESSSSIVYV